ncbi:uncharacterized protein [Epargyreus clarus]|uniref:uncharacterized protein n=1 Tax=Epargyreus clarus TaxID=520877 RepID=UPI003C2CC52B
MVFNLTKLLRLTSNKVVLRECHSIFGLKDLIQQEKLVKVSVVPVHKDKHALAIDIIKEYFLTEHALVCDRRMNVHDDRALDEYLGTLLKQGNSLFAKTRDGTIAGLCVNFASSPVDPKNLRNYAFYRQDPNTKDFLYFTAKLQETPNLWSMFKEPKIFQINMLTVLPDYRRQGLATMLVEKSQALAQSQGYKVIRMDCINPYDYKLAERCMLKCLTKFPLHKLRGANAPFIKRSSEYNRCIRVYVNARPQIDSDKEIKQQLSELEDILG